MKKIYIIAGSLFVVALIAIPIVKAELDREEVVLLQAGDTLGNRLADDWDWSNDSDMNFGAVASPDIMSPYLTVGGVRTWYSHMEFKSSSTTLCSILNPAATSTQITGISFSITSGTSTPLAGTILVFATSTLPQATSTLNTIGDSGNMTIAVDETKNFFFTPYLGGTGGYGLGADEYILLQVSTSTSGSVYTNRGDGLKGTCSVTYQEF